MYLCYLVKMKHHISYFYNALLEYYPLHQVLCETWSSSSTEKTRMWANAQRDGHPAEYRSCPLFNAAKFGWRPLLNCRAVMLPRRETRWNLQGCPKLVNRSQPLVGKSSPYCEDWRRYCCLTSFFPTVDTCLSCEDTARQSCAMVPRWQIFGNFLGPAFPVSRVHGVQHISDLFSKFALRPHHVWKYGRHPIWDG